MSQESHQLTCPHCSRILVFSGDRPRFCSFCGQPLTPRTPASEQATTPPERPPETPTVGLADVPVGAGDDVPGIVGGYRLLRRLGGGGMGSVYEAEDPVSGRRVALKLVLPEYAQSPEAVERFRQEGRLASGLSHPRCVFVLAADEDAGRPYIAMELMPGSTLDDLVGRNGPLPPEQAVRKILDVIDGLHEAHQFGLVHRDVKPSNCFLEADGRVKIGDFGLAKSLAADVKLTRTGTFLGTPLFAAPEQVKMERVNPQSDVYSVAATLYFLLTGRAPFQTGDVMATLARIVSENPPPMRSLRPELPRALDRVVLRGLERDRRRRWRDLDEFRKALRVFLPVEPSVGGLGLRFAAYLIDTFVLSLADAVAGQLAGLVLIGPATRAGLYPLMAAAIYSPLIAAAVAVTYYGVLEGRWGWSLGKRLLRLRVGHADADRPPGIGRAVLRAGFLRVLFNLGPAIVQLFLVRLILAGFNPNDPEQSLWLALFGLINLLWFALAVGLTLCTMRGRNGYRGLHEFASGTRTYRLRWPQMRKRRAVRRRDFRPELSQPDGLPERLGPFRVSGALRWTERERTLLAEDPQLGRQVWLWLRPAVEAPLEAVLRDVSRNTRVRWVACGRDGDWQWDAFLAPAGLPLSALAAGMDRLTWAEVRPILEDLTDELAASFNDGTLPRLLTPSQVWVEPSGRVRLLDLPLTEADADDGSETGDDEGRALRFLGDVAVLALEGGARPPELRATSVRAPLPPHAAEMLDRLLGVRKAYGTVEQFRSELEASRDRPAEMTRWRRAGHLALMTLLLHIPFMGPMVLLGMSFATLHDLASGVRIDPEGEFAFAVFSAGFWVTWAFLFRGGYAFWRGGLVLRRADGRKAARWQCALRALLVWAPVVGLLCLAIAVARDRPAMSWLYYGIWGAATLLLLAYIPLALASPARGPHDRLAGTYLVPP